MAASVVAALKVRGATQSPTASAPYGSRSASAPACAGDAVDEVGREAPHRGGAGRRAEPPDERVRVDRRLRLDPRAKAHVDAELLELALPPREGEQDLRAVGRLARQAHRAAEP